MDIAEIHSINMEINCALKQEQIKKEMVTLSQQTIRGQFANPKPESNLRN